MTTTTDSRATPFGDYTYPFSGEPFAHLFSSADSFHEVDEAWKAEPDPNDWLEREQLKIAALDRCRELRDAGTAIVPSSLPDDVDFALCQNDVELVALYALVMEDATGFNRHWTQEQDAFARERRAELKVAGVVTGRMPF